MLRDDKICMGEEQFDSISPTSLDHGTIGHESVPKIITQDTINLLFKLQSTFRQFQTVTVSECCLMNLLPYSLFEKKYTYISAPEMARPGNQHCANCIDTPFRFYRAMLCIRGTSHGPVSLCLSVRLSVRPSVRHKSVFY